MKTVTLQHTLSGTYYEKTIYVQKEIQDLILKTQRSIVHLHSHPNIEKRDKFIERALNNIQVLEDLEWFLTNEGKE